MYSGDKKKKLTDHQAPQPPYFLKATDLFTRENGQEIFIKHIRTISKDIPNRGTVIMAPGIATNANIYRIDRYGDILALNHNQSFANLLASEGFNVYLYNPGYTERVHNRYVKRYCQESRYFDKTFIAPSDLGFMDIVEKEIPHLIRFVSAHAGVDKISWIGYSMGGMVIYAYLSSSEDQSIENIISIGSPITLSQIFIRIIPYTNMLSKALGFEETAFLGTISEHFVPLTYFIRFLPEWALRYNILSMLLLNPLNIGKNVFKSFLGRIVEPIPAKLENDMAEMIFSGFSKDNDFIKKLKATDSDISCGRNFLFFFGLNDLIAPPDSVCLAHEIITPNMPDNLVKVDIAGHLDLLIGKTAFEKVWLPATEWLKEKSIVKIDPQPFQPFLNS